MENYNFDLFRLKISLSDLRVSKFFLFLQELEIGTFPRKNTSMTPTNSSENQVQQQENPLVSSQNAPNTKLSIDKDISNASNSTSLATDGHEQLPISPYILHYQNGPPPSENHKGNVKILTIVLICFSMILITFNIATIISGFGVLYGLYSAPACSSNGQTCPGRPFEYFIQIGNFLTSVVLIIVFSIPAALHFKELVAFDDVWCNNKEELLKLRFVAFFVTSVLSLLLIVIGGLCIGFNWVVVDSYYLGVLALTMVSYPINLITCMFCAFLYLTTTVQSQFPME